MGLLFSNITGILSSPPAGSLSKVRLVFDIARSQRTKIVESALGSLPTSVQYFAHLHYQNDYYWFRFYELAVCGMWILVSRLHFQFPLPEL